MSFQDKTLVCVECGDSFAFTANEQAFYAERGFTNEPKRCQTCRQSRKTQRTGGHSAGGHVSDSAGYGGQRALHTVTCSACGGEARVPFVPRGDRPVYCSDCFSQQRGSSGYSRAARY
ncbi:MAG: zinc-ribbon domain containing protein [Chloroflexi bacterium]|nr:zinc-ribbon domain containing protein [Chloroflexota bacterium]